MIRIVVVILALLAGAVSVSAQPATKEVVVLTSFPKELFEAYKQVLLEMVEPPADGWVKVRHRDGQQGFIRTTHVWGV